MYKSGENILNRQSCTDNTICRESETSELDIDGLHFTVRCCDKDLCNLNFERWEISAQNTNKINLFCLFLIIFIFCNFLI